MATSSLCCIVSKVDIVASSHELRWSLAQPCGLRHLMALRHPSFLRFKGFHPRYSTARLQLRQYFLPRSTIAPSIYLVPSAHPLDHDLSSIDWWQARSPFCSVQACLTRFVLPSLSCPATTNNVPGESAVGKVNLRMRSKFPGSCPNILPPACRAPWC